LAGALWSIGYCFGDGYYDHFFDAYGTHPLPAAEIRRLRHTFWPLSDPYLPRRSGIPRP
jgi:aminoglycoside phosphotransferase